MTDAATDNESSFCQHLREQSQPAWSDAVNHRFVTKLGDDSLSDDVFRRYLVQDYAFIDALMSLIGFGIGDAPTRDAKTHLTRFLGVLADDETEYFKRSFDALNVPRDTWDDPELTPVTQAFEVLLYRAAREGYPEALSVLVPAEWIYLTWASRMEADQSRFYLSEWVELHANPEFEQFVHWLQDELNAQSATLSAERRARVGRHFQRTCELEAAFFDRAFDE